MEAYFSMILSYYTFFIVFMHRKIREKKKNVCLPAGGDVLGGDVPICAAESRRPPSLCRIVDSSN